MTQTVERKMQAHNVPEVEYRDVASFFVTYVVRNRDTIVTESLASCPRRIFAQLVNKAVLTTTKPEAARRELEIAGLDYSHEMDRWYALLLLERWHAQAFWSRHREVYA